MPAIDINVQFGDPQDIARSGRAISPEWVKAAELLRDNAGQWAQVTVKEKRDNAAATAHSVRAAVLRAFEPAGSFEAKASPALNAENGEWGVFARYVGEQDPGDVNPWSAYTVKELKAECKARGLKVSGSQTVLADRLLEWENAQQDDNDEG